jgi:hypothetical protein
MWIPLLGLLARAFVDVLADQAVVVEFNGIAASAPHQFEVIGNDQASMVVIPRDLPRFSIDVPSGTATVRIEIAQERLPARFAEHKEEYDDTLLGIGVKTGIGLASGATSVAAFVGSGVLALLSSSVGVVPPLVALGVGGAGCLASVGLCGWSAVDIISAPEEPMIRRVHVVTLTPADTAQAPTSFDIDAPGLDSDRDPVEADPVPAGAIPGGTDVDEVVFCY